MIKVFDISQSDYWDQLVKSMPNYDVYYLSGYVKAFHLHGDGEPRLLYYSSKNLRAVYVYMLRQLIDGFYDIITPYGYGGVLFDGIVSKEALILFNEEYVAYMKKSKIVDNFVRYHPLLNNAENMRAISTVIDLGRTISIDLISEDIIWKNISSKNRNMIRKAMKNGVKICHGKELNLFNDFMRIYNSTMDKDEADSYYYFDSDFYRSIHEDLFDNYEMFYALYEGNIIAMSIIIFANAYMHYHLSGSLYEYRNLAPTNLLLYEAALWGCQQGFKSFHLGGGVGSAEDNLYRFKAGFNRMSNCQFSIGTQLFLQEEYDKLVKNRCLADKKFDINSSFFPLYRQ